MSNPAAKLCLLAVAGVALAACTTGRQHLSDDFGRSVREDLVAQIADPDARYAGDPAPASNGKRSALAQSRYERNAVIPPIASSVSGTMSIQGGGSGAPADAAK
jgi:hypothetical protein